MLSRKAFYQGGDGWERKQHGVLMWAVIALIAAGAWGRAQAADEGTKALSAKLPNGVAVELLGVTVHNAVRAGRGMWWAPDGTPMEAGPYAKPQRSCSGPFPGELIREFACCISGAEGYDATARTSLGDAAVDLWTVLNDENKTIVGPLRACVCRFKDGTSVGTFRIGVSTAPWQMVEQWKDTRWHTFDPDDTVVGESANPLVLKCPRQNGRRVILEIAHTYIEESRRFVITDRDGKTYANDLSTYGRGKGLVFEKAEFWDVKLEDVVLIEFQTRPYQWVEFNNISLVPETETKPQVRILGELSAQQADVVKAEQTDDGPKQPLITDLGIDISPETLKGKMLLICFWDFNQRPSRHLITELAKEAPILAGRGVITAAVQMGPAAEEDVRKWMQENAIEFPAASAKPEAAEQIRLKWDIKSLPWLVLTDSEHKVLAEGFSLSELDSMSPPLTISKDDQSDNRNRVTARKPKLTGIVRDAARRPVQGARVSRVPLWFWTLSDSSGRFELETRKTDASHVLATHPDRNLGALIEVADINKDVAIVLKPGVILSGSVRGTYGNPIVNAEIVVRAWINDRGMPLELGDIGTDAEGRYEVRGLPFDYNYSVSARAKGFGEDSVDARPGQAEDNRVLLEPIKLEIANLCISGIVVDSDGKPASEAWIFIAGKGQQSQEMKTDSSGKFHFDNVCPGKVRMTVDGATGRFTGEIDAGSADLQITLVSR